jgi:hypothetical protein
MSSVKADYELCIGTILRVTKTVMIAIIVEANPKDKAMISLVETNVRKISNVTGLKGSSVRNSRISLRSINRRVRDYSKPKMQQIPGYKLEHADREVRQKDEEVEEEKCRSYILSSLVGFRLGNSYRTTGI